jgi:hypothetical protein
MRLTPLIAALALVVSDTVAQQPTTTPSPLVGTWESIDRDQGQGSIMVFAADNSVAAVVSIMADGRYRRDGKRIHVTHADGITGDFSVVIVGDTLIQTKSGRSTRMTRVPGSGPDTGIVGKWRFRYEAPGMSARQATMEFTADGVHRIRLAVQTMVGTYSVSGSELTMSFSNIPPQTSTFSIDGGVLTMRRPDGAIARMARAR